MSLQSIGSRYFFLSFFILSFFSSLLIFYSCLSELNGFFQQFFGGFIFLDYVGFIFSVLSVFLGISLFICIGDISTTSFLFLLLSVFFSILCYNTCHSLMFWVFYELSILFLLALLVLDSPYSERYIASWYLLGYVVFTSLPMFLAVLYISLEVGSYDFGVWLSSYYSWGSLASLIILSILFITKIPLFPFHVWLPIVHAEAPSPVSVCLSGYIMKLGVLGLYRFCSALLPDVIFSPFYVSFVLVLSVAFFMAASRELDGKRWLAFLSLSHISFVCLGICVSDYSNIGLPFYFCLGHGLSAGATFILLWLFYDLSASRNWAVLKSSVFGSSYLCVVGTICLFSAASVPPTITFFSEVLILSSSLYFSFFLSFLFSLYLFFSGLVPLFLLGYILGRSFIVSVQSSAIWNYFVSLLFLVSWMGLLFILL